MTHPQLKDHPNFNVDDMGYLLAKGWTPAEIKDRWDEEAGAGKGPCKWEGETAKAKLAAAER